MNSQIDILMKQLCPEGVERVKLGEVCTFERGKTITAKDARDGQIPVIAGGQAPSYYHDEYNHKGETITVAGSGAYAGFVSYWDIPIWVSDAFTVEISDKLIHKYVYQFLKQNQQRIFETQKGAGVPHVHGKDIANFEIPLPPLAIQQEIVKILDKFTSLIDKIDEEINLRQKQYEYYREKLLTFEDGEVEWKKLGDICDFIRGPFGGSLKKEIFVKDGYAIYEQQNAIYGKFEFRYFITAEKYKQMARFKVQAGDIIMSCSGTMGKTAIIPDNPIEGVINQALLKLTPHKEIDRYFLKALCDSSYFKTKILDNSAGGAIQNVASVSILKKIEIPIPSKETQQTIVDTLDKFESLIGKLKEERNLRQKQYEYYREKLLTF